MNRQELEQCVHEYGKDLYAFCCRLTSNKVEADDLYQDTFLKAVELREQIEADGNPRSYLISIAMRIWKNRRRKAAWRSRIAAESGGSGSGESKTNAAPAGFSEMSPVEETALDHERTRLVRESVAGLPERYRIPLYLHYTANLSVQQIAKMLRLPDGTVKSRLHKARKLLKVRLEGVLDET